VFCVFTIQIDGWKGTDHTVIHRCFDPHILHSIYIYTHIFLFFFYYWIREWEVVVINIPVIRIIYLEPESKLISGIEYIPLLPFFLSPSFVTEVLSSRFLTVSSWVPQARVQRCSYTVYRIRYSPSLSPTFSTHAASNSFESRGDTRPTRVSFLFFSHIRRNLCCSGFLAISYRMPASQ
jgi:hypothetical protein